MKKILIIIIFIGFLVAFLFVCEGIEDDIYGQERIILYKYDNVQRENLGNGHFRYTQTLSKPFRVERQENTIYQISRGDTISYVVNENYEWRIKGENFEDVFNNVNDSSFVYEFDTKFKIKKIDKQIINNLIIGKQDTTKEYIGFEKDGITILKLLDVKGFDEIDKEIKVKSIEIVDNKVKYKFDKKVKSVDPTWSWQPDATAGKDANIYENNPTTNYGTNVAITVQWWVNKKYRGLIDFVGIKDSIDAVSIDSAYVEFCESNSSGIKNVHGLSIITSWNEGDVTWNTAPTFTNVKTDSLTTATGDWWKFDIKSYIEDIELKDSTYYGFCFKQITESGDGHYVNFVSSDDGTAANRPKITVYYTEEEEEEGDIITSSQGSVIHRARGYEVEKDRNKGIEINTVRKGRP